MCVSLFFSPGLLVAGQTGSPAASVLEGEGSTRACLNVEGLMPASVPPCAAAADQTCRSSPASSHSPCIMAGGRSQRSREVNRGLSRHWYMTMLPEASEGTRTFQSPEGPSKCVSRCAKRPHTAGQPREEGKVKGQALPPSSWVIWVCHYVPAG